MLPSCRLGYLLRVGIAIYNSLDTLTGGYLYNRMLVERLRNDGHVVEIISQRYADYSNMFSLVKRLKHLPIDVLIQDEATHPLFFLLNPYLRTRVSYPIISIVHHLRSNEQCSAWQKRLYGQIERRYLMTADGFIFNSLTTQRSVERFVRGKHPYVVAYPAGNRFTANIAPEEIAARAKEQGPLRLLFVGNVIRRKELHTLLAAMAQLPRDVCTLTVAGNLSMDKPYVNAIRRSVEEYGLADRVLLLGSTIDTELVFWLKESQIMVVPSSYEGYGIVYVEGMGFGLPAIATTAGAAGEIITHGSDGLLIQVGDAGSLAVHLNDLYHDRDWLASMSLNARRRFECHPSWQMTTEHIVEFLKTITNKGTIQPAGDPPLKGVPLRELE